MTGSHKVVYRFHGSSDTPDIVALLKANQLPFEDIVAGKIKFILAVFDHRIIGCIGLEVYEEHGLLRSLAVHQQYQSQGIGSVLVDYLVGYGNQLGIKTLHLLTLTAPLFFKSRGFIETHREQAPMAIQETAEFTHLCPASESIYMVKKDILQEVQICRQGLLQLKTEKNTGSSYWEVSGQNTSFTHFEVSANRTFPRHQHKSEQITHVLQGTLFFKIDGKVSALGPGDSIVIPSNVPHEVWTEGEKVSAVDCWSPPFNVETIR